MERRARTRRLIELGGLVEKSGVLDAFGDDDPDAILLGALLIVKGHAEGRIEGQGEGDGSSAGDYLALWRRRGRRALRGTDQG